MGREGETAPGTAESEKVNELRQDYQAAEGMHHPLELLPMLERQEASATGRALHLPPHCQPPLQKGWLD